MGHRMDLIRLLLHELPKGKSAPREALGHQAAPKVQTGPGLSQQTSRYPGQMLSRSQRLTKKTTAKMRHRHSLGASVSLKRNLIIHISARAAHAARRRRLRRRRGRAAIAARIVGGNIAAARAPAAGTIKQCELAAETLQHHLSRIAVLAGLVLPFCASAIAPR